MSDEPTSDQPPAISDARALDFKEFRARVGDLRGREYWRSLEELSRSDEFDRFFEQEFPRQAAPLANGVDRRNFLKLMGASVALGGLAACNYPAEKIIPYVRQPENLVPGKPIFFASAMPLLGYATGVLVESHMYRPTKIEGNPDHTSSRGASDAFMQASVLGLYDPDRSQVVRRLGEIATWSDFLAALVPVMKNASTNGAGLRLLTQTITSPTLGAQIKAVLAKVPGMKWHQWDAAGRDNVREGLRRAFGGYVDVHYDFTRANVIVSLDSDVLDSGPGHLRYAKDFASRRRVRKDKTTSINRVYAIESGPSGIGSMADHRLPVKPSEIESYARAIAANLGLGNAETAHGDWIGALVRDLQKNHGASIVVAGDQQPPAVHAIAMAINQALGNIGTTVLVTDSAEVAPANQLASVKELVADMNAGNVRALIMLGGNPVFDAPADLEFGHALVKVPFRAHLSLYYDETSMLSHWHIPETHYLESWSDARAHDGTVSIIQPLIAPLYNGRSPHEVIGAMAGGMDIVPYDAVRNYWSGAQAPSSGGFENTWRKWLHDGFIEGTALPARSVTASLDLLKEPYAVFPFGGYEIQLRPDPTILDGRFANNGWLQELPKPQTKITWDNVALVSPNTFREITKFPDDKRDSWINEKRTVLADVTFNGATAHVPLWVLPGQPDGVVTLTFGYGRRQGGKIAVSNGEVPYGVDIYPLRKSSAMDGGAGAAVVSANLEYDVACTQEHQSLNPKDLNGFERPIIRSASFEEYRKNPNFAHEHEEAGGDESMYPNYVYKGHAWAMVIDTSVCTGCNGCVVACVSENNISIVGKDQVHAEREMHWLRIDRYYKGDPENPTVYHQPVPCMQCENAPCEPVCPVEATSHSDEGLNDMTYNRCVGTRYCSNNCPYKVRRFNFYAYADYDTPALKPMRNPDVTIRTRGVMEKCTYCVQRINGAKIEAEKQNRRVRDGEVTTACAQACPTEAIVFGDMNDPTSAVAQLKAEPTNYALLGELNTRPRTTYLANVRNPNPEIK
jgi:molybdopterin-containing oxidoreductase family iron-sulfur binding subunit